MSLLAWTGPRSNLKYCDTWINPELIQKSVHYCCLSSLFLLSIIIFRFYKLWFSGVFFCLNMMLITLANFLSVLVINIYFRGDMHGPVPKWLKVVSKTKQVVYKIVVRNVQLYFFGSFWHNLLRVDQGDLEVRYRPVINFELYKSNCSIILRANLYNFKLVLFKNELTFNMIFSIYYFL